MGPGVASAPLRGDAVWWHEAQQEDLAGTQSGRPGAQTGTKSGNAAGTHRGVLQREGGLAGPGQILRSEDEGHDAGRRTGWAEIKVIIDIWHRKQNHNINQLSNSNSNSNSNNETIGLRSLERMKKSDTTIDLT